MTAWLRFLACMWARRLNHAHRYRAILEREQRREIERADADIERCEIMKARARMAVVQHRADRAVRHQLRGDRRPDEGDLTARSAAALVRHVGRGAV